MPVKLLLEGRKHNVLAWHHDGYCQIETFLFELAANSSRRWKKAIALITQAAEYGPPENEEICRLADGKTADDLFLFYLGGGICVFWFYYEDNIVIISCTNNGNSKSERAKALLIRQKLMEDMIYDSFT